MGIQCGTNLNAMALQIMEQRRASCSVKSAVAFVAIFEPTKPVDVSSIGVAAPTAEDPTRIII
jgi:hypothetical protein